MATQTESESSGGGVLMRDRLVKRAGEVAAGGFMLAIGGLLVWILSTQVNYELLASPLIARRFAEAFFLVVQIVVISSLLSVSLGVLVGLGRISTSNVTGRIAKGYVEFFRGTPLLFQLFVIYFGVPRLWATGEFPFSDWAIPAAIIGLTLNHGAYVGEAIRGGIDAVPDGQMEAARSLGMSRVMALREVVLPQAWRNALAAIGNDQIILVKDTSLLTVIAVPEIMSVFRNINSNQLDPWTPLVWVCVLYLAITMSMSQLVNGLERRSDWGSDSGMFGRLSGLGSGGDADGGEES
ncbi:polar amino acid transport system permease protein [Halorubrum trapanicum]|uniref:Polar amino acid transport system permease protein n=2 Tax=Halorubrum trapanicum TaxID=29284 RepID=A0A8J7UKB7_9EURY|nr:polar amino acid transport system permease protein [Halorubrum trapanicum]